jgi:hypothetical protein
MSMLGVLSMPRLKKEYNPTTVITMNAIRVGTGFLIDQVERWKDMPASNIAFCYKLYSRHSCPGDAVRVV